MHASAVVGSESQADRRQAGPGARNPHHPGPEGKTDLSQRLAGLGEGCLELGSGRRSVAQHRLGHAHRTELEADRPDRPLCVPPHQLGGSTTDVDHHAVLGIGQLPDRARKGQCCFFGAADGLGAKPQRLLRPVQERLPVGSVTHRRGGHRPGGGHLPFADQLPVALQRRHRPVHRVLGQACLREAPAQSGDHLAAFHLSLRRDHQQTGRVGADIHRCFVQGSLHSGLATGPSGDSRTQGTSQSKGSTRGAAHSPTGLSLPDRWSA